MIEKTESVAWIVGGSGGIGSAIAFSLAKKGIHLAIGYFSNKPKAEEIARKCIHLYKVKAQAIMIDVRSQRSVQKSYAQVVDQLGSPSMIIHVAGKTKAALLQDHSQQHLNELIDVHLKGMVYIIQASLPFLVQQKNGRILMISSIWGEVGGSFEALYSMVKGGQIALTKSLAKELAPSAITVNAITPGAIDTKMLSQQLDGVDCEHLLEYIPMGRLGKPQEVASLACYLCSKSANYITGQIIRVSGGWDG